jgi:hypothetical protein
MRARLHGPDLVLDEAQERRDDQRDLAELQQRWELVAQALAAACAGVVLRST